MATTTQLQFFDPSGVNATAGWTFDREDSQNGLNPIPLIVPGPGTNYSWLKFIGLVITIGANTNINNLYIGLRSALPTGLRAWYQTQMSFTNPSSGNRPAFNGANGANPGGYTEITTTPSLYDTDDHSGITPGLVGPYLQIVLGVDATCTSTDPTIVDLSIFDLSYSEE